MKKAIFISLFSILFLFSQVTGCSSDPSESIPVPTSTKNKVVPQSEYTYKNFSIKAKNEKDLIYVISSKEIVLSSGEEFPEYTLTGTFNGKISNTAKEATLNLNGVSLSNKDEPAIYSTKNISILTCNDSINSVISTGREAKKKAAIISEKALVICGDGSLAINSNICHGIKGNDVRIKGNLSLNISGEINGSDFAPDGSCINCKTFSVEEGQNFSVKLQQFKHAIKADDSIEIASGNFTLEKVRVAFKTDIAEKGGIAENHIYITGGSIISCVNNIQTDDEQIKEGVITYKLATD